jgi:DNA-binding NarL/FixJ family response regulator
LTLVLYTKKPVLVAGLAPTFASCDIVISTVVDNLPDLTDAAVAHAPEVLLIDLDDAITLAVLTNLREAAPEVKIILWVESISTEFAYQAMGAGVRGILRNSLATDLITKCVTKVQEGELWIEKALTDEFIQARRVQLTNREGQLIVLLTQGLQNKEIAWALHISEGTVKVYMSRLFHKLQVSDRFELALYGLQNLTTGHGSAIREHRAKKGTAPVFGLKAIVFPAFQSTPGRAKQQ